MYKLGFYVPESYLEVVKAACFAQGAGQIGNYDSCCWQVKGEGQFRPLDGSQPYLGREGEVEKVSEYRVEMVIGDELARAVVDAMIAAHPYEEPAWDLVQLVTELPS